MSYILQPKGARSGAGNTETAAPGVPIKCPRCQTPYTAQIVNVIDARLNPELKVALLNGYLNRVVCPGCGAVSLVNVPLIYHDPDKELLLVLVPNELNLPADQQQRLIGGLVQAIMSSVPPEERKGYFLRPQTILSMQRMIEVILEADGVTPEMLQAQRQRFQLLSELLRAQDDPARLESLIQEHKAELDYAFFASLVAAAQESEMAGDTEAAGQLITLRDRLLQNPELASRLPQPLPPDTTLASALDRLLALADDPNALAAMIMINRPAFDYSFFQGLTEQMEQARTAGDTARAEQLAALRARLLEEIEKQDRALQAAQQEDLRLLDEMLKSPEPETAIRQHLAQIDSLFLSTLAAATEGARRAGDIQRSARLDGIRQSILSMLAESMPPELRLINRLLSLETPEERQAVLDESAALLNEDLLGLIEGLQQELQGQGQTETARRLEAIVAEIRQKFANQGGI